MLETAATTSQSFETFSREALNQLSKGDIVEVKAMGKPPGGPDLGSAVHAGGGLLRSF